MHFLLRGILGTLLAMALLILPTSVMAQVVGTCTGVSAMETIAGLGTEGSVSGCRNFTNIKVSISSPSGNQFFKTVTTDASGKGTFTLTGQQTQIAGSYDLEAGATGTFNVLADKPSIEKSSISASKTMI